MRANAPSGFNGEPQGWVTLKAPTIRLTNRRKRVERVEGVDRCILG